MSVSWNQSENSPALDLLDGMESELRDAHARLQAIRERIAIDASENATPSNPEPMNSSLPVTGERPRAALEATSDTTSECGTLTTVEELSLTDSQSVVSRRRKEKVPADSEEREDDPLARLRHLLTPADDGGSPA